MQPLKFSGARFTRICFSIVLPIPRDVVSQLANISMTRSLPEVFRVSSLCGRLQQADLGLNLTTKRTRKQAFLAEMERVVPWQALVDLITPYAPDGKRGRPPFAVETMLRIHFMQQWFTLSDPAMEEALHDVPLFREFAGLNWDTPVPDETTILRFRRLLEEHKLSAEILALINELLSAKGLLLHAGTVVDATLIAARFRLQLQAPVKQESYEPLR